MGPLRGPALVVPIEPTALGDFDDGAPRRGLYRSGFRAVPGESLVAAPLMVVGEVRGQHAPQVPSVEHDDVIETLPANAADPPS